MILQKQLVILGIGLFFGVILLYFLRRRYLRPEYALVWVLLISMILVLGLFPDIASVLVWSTGMDYRSSVILFVFVFIAGMFLNVSLIACRHGRCIVRLTQEIALLRAEIREMKDGETGEGVSRPHGPASDD